MMSIKLARFVTGRSKNMTSRFASLTEKDNEKIAEDKELTKNRGDTGWML